MAYFFMPKPLTKKTHIKISPIEVHEKLDTLNHILDKRSIIDFERGNFYSYFPSGNNEFIVENSFKIRNQGYFHITGSGKIITMEDGCEIEVVYMIENPYLTMFFAVWYCFIALVWCLVIFGAWNTYGNWEPTMVISIFMTSLFTFVPILFKIMMTGYMQSLHGKVLKTINKN